MTASFENNRLLALLAEGDLRQLLRDMQEVALERSGESFTLRNDPPPPETTTRQIAFQSTALRS